MRLLFCLFRIVSKRKNDFLNVYVARTRCIVTNTILFTFYLFLEQRTKSKEQRARNKEHGWWQVGGR